MTISNELWVRRDNIEITRPAQVEISSLREGQILVEIERFALSANNVTYAVSADSLGYWNYFPGDAVWGRVPVWGFATVVESKCREIRSGERIWGFFPMASHAVLTPGGMLDELFIDISPHRSELPSAYNEYRRTDAEPPYFRGMDNERCLLYPLYGTAFLICDHLVDNNFFGASQVIISSASSKTASGLAYMLRHNTSIKHACIGVTSEENVSTVKELGCYDQVINYRELPVIDTKCSSIYVDMSGNADTLEKLHNHLGDNVKKSYRVGVTHWKNTGSRKGLPGARPEFFFAPHQIAKREKDWGRGVVQKMGMKASAEAAKALGKNLSIDWVTTTDGLSKTWCDMVENKIRPNRGLMVKLL